MDGIKAKRIAKLDVFSATINQWPLKNRIPAQNLFRKSIPKFERW
jgi:hypothetical protein